MTDANPSASAAEEAPSDGMVAQYGVQLTFNVKDFRLRAAVSKEDGDQKWELRRWASGTAQLVRPHGTLAPRDRAHDQADQLPLSVSPRELSAVEPGLLYPGVDGGLYLNIPEDLYQEMAADHQAGRMSELSVMVKVGRAWTASPFEERHYCIENEMTANYQPVRNCTLISLNWKSNEVSLLDHPGILSTKKAADLYWERQEEKKEREAELAMRRNEARAQREAPMLRALYSISNHLLGVIITLIIVGAGLSLRGCIG